LKRRNDEDEERYRLVPIPTGRALRLRLAVNLDHLSIGGKKGGPARAAAMTPEQRSESARKAVQARWAKKKKVAG
jgi:hypothetical protein